MTSYLDGVILDVDTGDSGRIEIAPDGREVHQSQIVFSQKGFEMMRQGYLCVRCLQDLRPLGAFPDECPCCSFPVKELQLQKLERDFGGVIPLGPKLSLSDELERMGDLWLPES